MTITKLEYEDGTNRFDLPAVLALVAEQLAKDERPYFTSLQRRAGSGQRSRPDFGVRRALQNGAPGLRGQQDDQLAKFVIDVIKHVANKIDREPAE